MNVIIVAGGNGTRFKNLSVFPKILLPFKDASSIIEKDVDIFKNDEIGIIINSKFYKMTKNHLDVNNLSDKVVLYETSNTNGSYNSILDCIHRYEEFPKEDVLFVWSDLILENHVSCTENTIFTYNGNYRYVFDGETIVERKEYDGNVPGIYYLKTISDIFNIELDKIENFDLVEALKLSGCSMNKQDLESVIECKDYDTYLSYVSDTTSKKLKTRFFNELKVDGDVLTKKAIDEKYFDIIKREFNWYAYGYSNIDDFEKIVPKIYLDSFHDNSFSMQYLKDYIPLHECLKTLSSKDDMIKIYDNIQTVFAILHKNTKIVDYQTFSKDLKKEVVDKVISRCDSIQHMLLNYNRNELIDVLTTAYDYLLSLENGNVEYVFTHGDLNGSNLLVNQKTFEVKFIDPRGYFGNSNLYGWKPYEYAKLLYCLYGYDEFNKEIKIYQKDEPICLRWHDEIDFLNKKEYKILVGVIYVALAGYISQDIMKVNIAYEYGMKLLKQELND